MQTSTQFDKSNWFITIFFILWIHRFFLDKGFVVDNPKFFAWKSVFLYDFLRKSEKKGCKIDGFLMKIDSCALTCLAWKTKSVSECKILHFEKHGISLNTFEKQAMFLEMQNFTFRKRFCFSRDNMKCFPCNLL